MVLLMVVVVVAVVLVAAVVERDVPQPQWQPSLRHLFGGAFCYSPFCISSHLWSQSKRCCDYLYKK